MIESVVRDRAFAMPLTSPAYPPGPYRFVNREFLIITYRTDPDALAAVIPAPLEMTDPIVKFEFIRMPDSTGFGDYTEAGQVIPVRFGQQLGGYVHAMFLDCEPPVERSGDSRRSSPRPKCELKRTRSAAFCDTALSPSHSRRWGSSIALCPTTRSWLR